MPIILVVYDTQQCFSILVTGASVLHIKRRNYNQKEEIAGCKTQGEGELGGKNHRYSSSENWEDNLKIALV